MRIKYFLPVLLSAVLGMNGCFHEIEKNSPQEQLTTSLAPDCPVPAESAEHLLLQNNNRYDHPDA